MFETAVRLLFGRTPPPLTAAAVPHGPVPVPEPASATPAPSGAPLPLWPASRLALADQLWEPGYIFPGGEAEALRLARPLGLSAASSLLVVGIGAGGPAAAVVRNLGAWVTGVDTDASLLAAARGFVRRAQLGKKAVIKPWNPMAPDFEGKTYHHCLALDPLKGARPEPILDQLFQSLKASGQLVMTELVADKGLNPKDPHVRRWAELEQRDPTAVPVDIGITRMLGRIGMDVRVAEDISPRYMENALVGWRQMLTGLRAHKPKPAEAAVMVAEAELWLLRRRLFREGQLRLMRWHAISRKRPS